jgi:hypothetical protein
MITIDTTNQNTAIATWNYQTSVDRIRDMYTGSWRKVSKQLLEELYQAKLQINRGPGNPTGHYTWKQYCLDAFGKYPTQRTVDTWLKRHEIGEAAWNDLVKEKANSMPVRKDEYSLFIVKRKKNKDGTYTVRFSVSEYPNTIFEEKIIA